MSSGEARPLEEMRRMAIGMMSLIVDTCERLEIAGSIRRGKEAVRDVELYLIRNWLEAEVFSAVYRPGAMALVPYLLNEGGQTITEVLIQGGKLPLLMSEGR